MALQTLRAMAGGGIYDQIGGGFARYSIDAAWTVAALREDALRQRAAGARLPARLAAVRPRGPAAHGRGDARLAAARDDRARGRLLLGAGRRLRGRRGQVLRVVHGRAARGARRRRRRRDPVVRRRRRRATSRVRTSSSRAGPSPSPSVRERLRAEAARGPRGARAPGPGRQAPDGLERAGDQRARRRRRGARARRLPRRRPARRRFLAGDDARRRRSPAAHLQRRPGEAQRLPRGPRVPARGAARALRGDVRAALVPGRARDRRHDDRALRRPRARRLLSDLERPRAARRAAQGSRRRPDPVGLLERRPRAAAARGADRRGALRAARARRPAARRRRRLPPPAGASATRCRRWTSSSRPARRSRSSATTRASSRASCAPRFARNVVVAGGDGADADGVALLEGRTPVDGRAAAYVCEHFAAASRSPSPPTSRRCSPTVDHPIARCARTPGAWARSSQSSPAAGPSGSSR